MPYVSDVKDAKDVKAGTQTANKTILNEFTHIAVTVSGKRMSSSSSSSSRYCKSSDMTCLCHLMLLLQVLLQKTMTFCYTPESCETENHLFAQTLISWESN